MSGGCNLLSVGEILELPLSWGEIGVVLSPAVWEGIFGNPKGSALVTMGGMSAILLQKHGEAVQVQRPALWAVDGAAD